MTAGLALALASALGTNFAFLFKQRGALLAPPVRGRHPLRSAVGLFRSRWFSLGWAVAVAAWALHVGALALAPLSVVQAVLSGGLVFLGVLAERYFGFHLGRWQWAGMTITAFGLAVIAITGGRHTNAVRHYSPAALIAVECGVFALGAALIGISMHGRVDPAAEGLLLGVASGVLFGVSDIALKYLTEALQGGLDGIVSEWTLAALAASVLAFYASARGLQLGPGVAVIAFTSVAANLAAIMGGILVFRDPIGIGAASTAPRCLNKKLRFVAGAEPSARINPRNMVVMRQHAATRLSTSGRPIGAGGESGSTPLLPQRVSPILRGSARLLPCGYQVGRFRPTKQCQRS